MWNDQGFFCVGNEKGFSSVGSIETNDLGWLMCWGGVFGYSPGRLVGRITLQAASQPETYCSTSIMRSHFIQLFFVRFISYCLPDKKGMFIIKFICF